MKHYLVAYNGNYADEFNVYFHQVMTEDELKEAKDLISKTYWKDEEFYFGTNEYIEVNYLDLLEDLSNAKEITEDQYKVLSDLNLLSMGFGDGLNWNHLICYAEDNLSTYE